jgi:DNA-binding HxlR family transcriptional regulator
VKRRDLDGCPIAGALQMVGDKWTMLIIRELVHGPKRTMAIHAKLEGLSSRTLVARLKDLGKDRIVVRKDFGGNPPHIEYTLTARGKLLLPLLDALRETGQVLGCYECEDHKRRQGEYCATCPNNGKAQEPYIPEEIEPVSQPIRHRRERDDSIVLL